MISSEFMALTSGFLSWSGRFGFFSPPGWKGRVNGDADEA
jgi:hypothetical protein